MVVFLRFVYFVVYKCFKLCLVLKLLCSFINFLFVCVYSKILFYLFVYDFAKSSVHLF